MFDKSNKGCYCLSGCCWLSSWLLTIEEKVRGAGPASQLEYKYLATSTLISHHLHLQHAALPPLPAAPHPHHQHCPLSAEAVLQPQLSPSRGPGWWLEQSMELLPHLPQGCPTQQCLSLPASSYPGSGRCLPQISCHTWRQSCYRAELSWADWLTEGSVHCSLYFSSEKVKKNAVGWSIRIQTWRERLFWCFFSGGALKGFFVSCLPRKNSLWVKSLVSSGLFPIKIQWSLR